MTEIEFAQAPDPEAMGRIRKIVSSAHKWGGDGKKPSFRKIRRVLMRRHPEVIAKAFGGNANVAAAWIKNNWYRMRGQNVPPTRGKKAVSASLSLNDYIEVERDVFGDDAVELFCAAEGSTDGDLTWVTALRTGTWKVNPIAGAKGPLVIDKAFLDDVMLAWNEKAWEFVTVPTYHTDQDLMANAGFVRDLKVVPDPERSGHYLLRAAIEFTEPEVAERVARKTIRGVSVNVKMAIRHQETGKLFNRVLTHIALTNMPFINGLRAFEQNLAASSDVITSYEFDDVSLEEGFDDLIAAMSEGAWDPETDMEYVKQQIMAQLKSVQADGEGYPIDPRNHPAMEVREAHWYIVGMTPDEVLICGTATEDGESDGMASMMSPTGECEGWIAGYELDANKEVILDPVDEWTHVEQRWVEVSDAEEAADDAAEGESEDESGMGMSLNSGTGVPINYGMSISTTSNVWPTSSTGVPWIWVNSGDTLTTSVQPPTTSPRGGDSMTEVIENSEQVEEVTLSREDLDRIADERAQAALTAYRQEVEERERARDEELAATRVQLHQMTVSARVDELVAAGHSPAVIQLAREIMLADVRGEQVLSLNRSDGEVSLSATDIVTELLAAFPPSALSTTEIPLPAGGNKPDSETVSARADSILEFLNQD